MGRDLIVQFSSSIQATMVSITEMLCKRCRYLVEPARRFICIAVGMYPMEQCGCLSVAPSPCDSATGICHQSMSCT